MNLLVTPTIEAMENPTILRRIAGKDKTAVKDCIEAYGNIVWTLARKFTRSHEEAEAATQEIFTDIWRYCEGEWDTRKTEEKLIAMIALRRLIRTSPQVSQTSLPNINVPNERGV